MLPVVSRVGCSFWLVVVRGLIKEDSFASLHFACATHLLCFVCFQLNFRVNHAVFSCAGDVLIVEAHHSSDHLSLKDAEHRRSWRQLQQRLSAGENSASDALAPVADAKRIESKAVDKAADKADSAAKKKRSSSDAADSKSPPQPAAATSVTAVTAASLEDADMFAKFQRTALLFAWQLAFHRPILLRPHPDNSNSSSNSSNSSNSNSNSNSNSATAGANGVAPGSPIQRAPRKGAIFTCCCSCSCGKSCVLSVFCRVCAESVVQHEPRRSRASSGVSVSARLKLTL